MVALTCDAARFERGLREARLATLTLRVMLRPQCPICKRQVVTIGSRPDGEMRVRYLGCRRCKYRAKEPEQIDIDLTGHRSSNYLRGSSGRFVSER